MSNTEFEDSILDSIELTQQFNLVVEAMWFLTPSELNVIYAVLSGTDLEEYAKKTGKSFKNCQEYYLRATRKLKTHMRKIGATNE